MARALLAVNMGGPADAAGVEPYLRAIFHDPFILPVPGVLRPLVAGMIARRRAPKVAARYERIGGGSPLARWTEALVANLSAGSAGGGEDGADRVVRHAFRYTDPLIPAALADLAAAGCREVTLLPLFPHATRAMTGSVEHVARREAERLGLGLLTVPAWWEHPAVLALQRGYLARAVAEAGDGARVLFVAHGIPERDVPRDAPTYPDQVAANAASLGADLPDGTDWRLAYQSRLGPVKWTGPYVEDALAELARTPAPVVIVPLSFVADCLETMWDLDEEARAELAAAGVSRVVRVPAYNDDPAFAAALREVVASAEADGAVPAAGDRGEATS